MFCFVILRLKSDLLKDRLGNSAVFIKKSKHRCHHCKFGEVKALRIVKKCLLFRLTASSDVQDPCVSKDLKFSKILKLRIKIFIL